MKKIFVLGMFVLVLGMGLLGCGHDFELYTCWNLSSHEVRVFSDKSKNYITIPAGQYKSVWLFDGITLSDLLYTPADLVSVAIQGGDITFRNRL